MEKSKILEQLKNKENKIMPHGSPSRRVKARSLRSQRRKRRLKKKQ